MKSAVPSIRKRLNQALVGWALIWGMAVTSALVLTTQSEVRELLDDTLQASAEVMVGLLVRPAEGVEKIMGSAPVLADPGGVIGTQSGDSELSGRFAWQVVGINGQLLRRSKQAPEVPLHAVPTPGFSDTAQWRVFGRSLGPNAATLYVAQTRLERREAEFEIALGAALATLALGMLGLLWLNARIKAELAPIQQLSDRLAGLDPSRLATSLGSAEREELQAVHSAIDELGQRLAQRLARERAFSAHAAHALRTPLAGMDAQLAVALRECPADMAPRLRRVREAGVRLQRVVAALLSMFRSESDLKRSPVDLAALLARLPVEGLTVHFRQQGQAATLQADPDLLAAALLNLFDNALRYGARGVTVEIITSRLLRVSDDGPGVSETRRLELLEALGRQADDLGTGLGLRLADLVAKAHGGWLDLLPVERGFSVEMNLG